MNLQADLYAFVKLPNCFCLNDEILWGIANGDISL